jgi:hypothetical protein
MSASPKIFVRDRLVGLRFTLDEKHAALFTRCVAGRLAEEGNALVAVWAVTINPVDHDALPPVESGDGSECSDNRYMVKGT